MNARTWRLFWVSAVWALLVMVVGGHTQSLSDAAREAFSAYLAGDLQTPTRLAERLVGSVTVPVATASVKVALATQRPPAAATFALELANSIASARDTADGSRRPQRRDLYEAMLELGKEHAKQSGPEFLHLWYRGAASSLLGPGVVFSGAEIYAVYGVDFGREFIRQAAGQYDTDGSLRLAYGLSWESAFRSMPSTVSWSSREQRLKFAVDNFTKAQADPVVAEEATLRIGVVRHLQGRSGDARAIWTGLAGNAQGSDVRFLAHLFLGQSLAERPDTHQEAVSAFRAALSVVPDAPSALAPLAALYRLEGDVATSENIARKLTTESQVADPYVLYFTPGYRDLHSRLIDLRKSAGIPLAPR